MAKRMMYLSVIVVFFLSLFIPYLPKASAEEAIEKVQQTEEAKPEETKVEKVSENKIVVIKDKQLKKAIIEELGLEGNDIYTSDLEELTSLTAPYLDIKDLTGIEQAVNLTSLNISGNPLTSLDQLKQLKKLEDLDISDYQGSDFASLQALTNLKTLNISGTDVKNLDTVSSLVNLESLNISFTKITDLSSITKLTNLKALNISYLELKTIKPLKDLSNLRTLEVYGELYFKLLDEMTELERTLDILHDEELNLWIDSIKASEDKVSLSWSYMGEQKAAYYLVTVNGKEERINSTKRDMKWEMNALKPNTSYDIKIEAYNSGDELIGVSTRTVKTLPNPTGDKIIFKDQNLEKAIKNYFGLKRDIVQSDMETITELDLYKKRIKDLTGLESAINLESLYIGDNRVEQISVLSLLKKLNVLILDGNPVKDFSALARLDNLQTLSVSDTGLNDLKVLDPLRNLETLTADRNEITDFSNISSFSKLKMLSLSGNGLKSLKEIGKLTTLEYLNISENPLQSLKGIELLINLHGLDAGSTKITSINELLSLENLEYVTLWNIQTLDITPNSEARKVISELEEKGVSIGFESDQEYFFIYTGNAKENSFELYWDYYGEKQINHVEILLNDELVQKVEYGKKPYLLEGLNPGTEYSITVKAYNAQNELLFENSTIEKTWELPSGKEIEFKDQELKEAVKEQLGIKRNPVESDMEYLNIVSLFNTNVKDLTGLEYAKNLYHFGAMNNVGNLDLTPLKNLPELMGISLSNTEVKDYSVLKEFERLYLVDVSGNKLEDISFISNFDKVQHLNLSNNEITNIKPLENLNQLSYIDLSNNKISDLTPLLQSKGHFASLDVSGNPVTDISLLSEFNELFLLNLDRTEVTDLKPLADIQSLEHLSLYGIKTLDLSKNKEVLDGLKYWGVDVNIDFPTRPKLSVNEVTDSSISISWEPMIPEKGGQYKVAIHTGKGDIIGEELTLDSSITNYTFTNLEPGTHYLISVAGEHEERYNYAFEQVKTLSAK